MTNLPNDLARNLVAALCILGLIAACFLVVRPFLAAIVWAATLVIATWPLMLKAEAAFGGRRWAAVTVMTVGLLLIVLLPLVAALAAVISQSDRLEALVIAAPNMRLPAPPVWLDDVPMVGKTTADRWRELAALGIHDLAHFLVPYVRMIARWLLDVAGNIGGLLIHLLVTIAFSAVLYARGEMAAAWAQRLGHRIAGERGAGAAILAGQAVRGVALGVVVTAVAQAIVASIGLLLAGVPHVALLSAVMLILCIAQLGPALVMIPAIIWLFTQDAVLAGIVLIAFTTVALVMDNFLRPFLIKRGADLPLLLILMGVIGGLLAFGLLGLFLGPVILAVAYTFVESWIAEDQPS